MTDHQNPVRLQLPRAKDARLPAGAVSVSRPGRWGNPWTISGARGGGFSGTDADVASMCVGFFRRGVLHRLPAVGYGVDEVRAALAGKNLACWCRLCARHPAGKPFGEDCPDCAPCHADVLGAIANHPICEAVK